MLKLVKTITTTGYLAQFDSSKMTVVVYVYNRELKKYVHRTMQVVSATNLKSDRLATIKDGKLVGKQQRVRIFIYENSLHRVEPLADIPTKVEFDFMNFPGPKKVG